MSTSNQEHLMDYVAERQQAAWGAVDTALGELAVSYALPADRLQDVARDAIERAMLDLSVRIRERGNT